MESTAQAVDSRSAARALGFVLLGMRGGVDGGTREQDKLILLYFNEQKQTTASKPMYSVTILSQVQNKAKYVALDYEGIQENRTIRRRGEHMGQGRRTKILVYIAPGGELDKNGWCVSLVAPWGTSPSLRNTNKEHPPTLGATSNRKPNRGLFLASLISKRTLCLNPPSWMSGLNNKNPMRANTTKQNKGDSSNNNVSNFSCRHPGGRPQHQEKKSAGGLPNTRRYEQRGHQDFSGILSITQHSHSRRVRLSH